MNNALNSPELKKRLAEALCEATVYEEEYQPGHVYNVYVSNYDKLAEVALETIKEYMLREQEARNE